MAALTTALAIGVGAAGLGLQYSGMQRQQAAYDQQAYIAQQQADVARQQTDVAKQQVALSKQFSGQDTSLNIESAQTSAEAAAKSQAINKDILGLGQQIQAKNAQAMEIGARRQQLEIIRNQQRARSLALSTANSQLGQGAQGSSALGGAYGQISGQTGVNILGVQQNLALGRDIYGLNQQVTGKNVEQADLVTQLAWANADLQTRKANLINQYSQQSADLQTRYAELGGNIATLQGQSSFYESQARSAGATAGFGGSLLGIAGPIASAGMNFNNIFAGSSIFNPGQSGYYTSGPLVSPRYSL